VRQKIHLRQFITKDHLNNLYTAYATNKVTDNLTIPTIDGFILIHLDEVIYCRAEGNYTQFILKDNKKYLASYTLKQYDEILTASAFFRTHRSYLVNLHHVKMYKKGEGGSIIMSNGEEIELSRQHKEGFLQIFKH